MRTFIAVELEDAVKAPLLKLIRERNDRSRDLRWCTPDQLHITLKFLGEIAETQVVPVTQVLEEVSRQVAPFAIALAGLGVFPSPRQPRVLWCGVRDADCGCARWVEQADVRLRALGFEPEQRAFTPHVTLARGQSRAGGGLLRRVLETAEPPSGLGMPVTRITLFESRLLPGGARYTVLAHAPLGA